MNKKMLVTMIVSVGTFSGFAGASQFLNCRIGDAVAGLNFSTTELSVAQPQSMGLQLNISSQNDEQPDRVYRAALSTLDRNSVLNGRQVVVVMKSDKTVEFGGESSESSIIVFNAGPDGMTLISDRGGVLHPKCK